MDWEHERTKLLPRSGVGIVSPWLVVAPEGNPVIRLDLRALDQIKLHTEDDADQSDGDAGPGERDHDPRCDVILACGDLEVAIFVADGPEAAELIVREAAPLTREATGPGSGADPSQLLIIGDDVVLQRGEYIQVGSIVFRTSEVREYAERGANLPLPGGRLLQAAIAMLVVAAAERDAAAST